MRNGWNGFPEAGIDHLTMLDVSPPDLVSVAREAGFDLVGLRVVPATPGEEPWPMTVDCPMLEETARRPLPAGIPVSVDAPVLSFQKSLSPVEFARRARAAVANVVPETGGNPDR